MKVVRSTVKHESPHARAVPGLPALIDSLSVRIGSRELIAPSREERRWAAATSLNSQSPYSRLGGQP